jgi:hypothetical protein
LSVESKLAHLLASLAMTVVPYTWTTRESSIDIGLRERSLAPTFRKVKVQMGRLRLHLKAGTP